MGIESLTDDELNSLAGGIEALPDDELASLAGNGLEDQYGIGETMMIGAGKTLTDIGRGAQKLYHSALGNNDELEELQAMQRKEQGYYDELSQARPFSTMGGEILPYLATAPLSGGLLTQMGIGAAGEGIRYSDNQGASSIMGGVMSVGGYGVGKMAPRVMGAIRGVAQSNEKALRALTKGQQRLVQRADDLNFKLKPGQKLQSKPLQQIERSADSMPFTSGLTEGMEKDNQALLNRLALESIGEVGDDIRGSQFANAADRIGKVYDDVAKNVGEIDIGQENLANLFDDMSVDGEKFVSNYVKKYPNLASGKLTGKEFNKLSSKVEKDIRGAYTTNPAVADDLIEFKGALHSALAKASPKDKEALRVAGKQWRNLKALEAGNSVTKGNVNPRSLSSRLNRIDKGGFKRERNVSDYYDAVRIADEIGGVADSQTATRSWLANVAQDPTSIAGGAALRPIYRKYLESGGSPVYANMLGAYPSNAPGQVGAAAGRAFESVDELPEFPELLE